MSIDNLEWNEEYEIGVPEIDDAHQGFFRIVRRIHNIADSKKNAQFGAQEGIKFLRTYTVKHFQEEEAYMKSIGYRELEAHRRQHAHLCERILPRIEAHLVNENYSPEAVDKFLKIMLLWLTRHIMVHDKAICWDKATPEAM